MFGIGEGELAIIVVFGFLLFGPDKLPQMGRTIGRAIRQFRETQEKMTAVVQSEIIDPVSEAASAPVKPKKAAVDDDSDADEDAAEAAAPAKKETFAERRARLAAEKAASEAAAEGEGAEPAEAEPAAAAEPVVEPEPAAEPEPEPEPVEPTTADLYARRPRKRKAVVDQLARELEAEDDAAAADASKGGDE
ncbi:twin-arginine translocase TatA/TatE family subunit [Collinsella aerofaciens]|uniref:twin-arginine translocase TatA/TatE family subunit n=1 Tax=Collinsella aerofaciens TaxID=74426 RepID=UPI001484E285|nr:twin-arginine translocase TatA/TatE family subunit [Collinsella aerofaciens]MDB1900617.1 twin-arginine translocase TatA/TatE family subunit [Collinsella aerofaciens]MDB1905265.1 twin-arginine translocase TatA/TatE family subunit [Collinsella aerofaciens]